MRKKLLAIIATAAMVVAMVPSMVFGVTGAGTATDPYVVNPTNFAEFLLSADSKDAVIELSAGDYSFVSPTTSEYLLENITIVGENAAVIKGFTLYENCHGPHTIDGLTFKNVTFDGTGVCFSAKDVKNITFDGCTFKNDARIIQNDGNEHISNLIVKNCEFEGDSTVGNTTKTAIMLENATEVTIINCTFKDIDFNAMQFGKLDGNIVIKENYIDNTGDRAIRILDGGNADIAINNNVMLSDGDDDGQLFKINSMGQGKIDLENNYWNGKDVTTAVNTNGAITAPASTGIAGGTFSEDVSDFLAEGYVQGDDGKVVEKSTAGTGSEGTAPVPEKSPNTGDNSMAPFAVAGLAMAAMAAVVVTRRRTN